MLIKFFYYSQMKSRILMRMAHGMGRLYQETNNVFKFRFEDAEIPGQVDICYHWAMSTHALYYFSAKISFCRIDIIFLAYFYSR